MLSTYRRPKYPQACHTALSSELLAKGNPVFRQNLQFSKDFNLELIMIFFNNLPNHACWSPCTSMARPKSASFTAAPLLLLASNRFSGYKEIIQVHKRGKIKHARKTFSKKAYLYRKTRFFTTKDHIRPFIFPTNLNSLDLKYVFQVGGGAQIGKRTASFEQVRRIYLFLTL